MKNFKWGTTLTNVSSRNSLQHHVFTFCVLRHLRMAPPLRRVAGDGDAGYVDSLLVDNRSRRNYNSRRWNTNMLRMEILFVLEIL